MTRYLLLVSPLFAPGHVPENAYPNDSDRAAFACRPPRSGGSARASPRRLSRGDSRESQGMYGEMGYLADSQAQQRPERSGLAEQ